MASSAVAMASSTVAMAASYSSSSPLIPRTHHNPLLLHHLPSSLPSFASSSSRLPRFLLLPRCQSNDPLNSPATPSNSPATPSPDSPPSSPVAVLDEQPPPTSTPKPKRPSALERGGTLSGEKALGKDPGPSVLGKKTQAVSISGKFRDPRWKNGNWDLAMFTVDGKVNWDEVIDAEVVRRKWLEENPEASRNDDPVVFETSTIPWWAWVKRFHLPAAELLNGRAAMLGFFFGYVIDSLTGVGLVDQTNSLLGKFCLLIIVVGVLVIRKNEDVDELREAVREWTFYDKQWQATWQDEQPPKSDKEE